MSATFSEMQASVKTWIVDLPTEVVAEVPKIINRVLRTMQQKHNWRVMEASAELVTTAGEHELGTIADFKEIRARPWLRFDDGGDAEIEWASSGSDLTRLYSRNDSVTDVGRPELLYLASLDEDNVPSFEVYPYPDGNSDWDDGEYRVNIPYWKYLPELVGSNDTNWFMNNCETYVLQASVAEAFAFNLDDEHSVLWLQRAQAPLMDALRQDKRGRSIRSGVLVPRSGVYGTRFSKRY